MYKVFDIDEKFSNLEEIYEYWKSCGYPLKSKSEYNLEKELEKVKKASEESLLEDGNKIKQNLSGNGLLWTYFPHWIDVSYKNSKSISECWSDDTKLMELVLKTYKYELKHNNRRKFSVNRIRQNAKVYCAKQSVSNFRPTAAKYIYNKYGNQGTVWDMSCGWGGRLFGFLASDCRTYIGTEPSTKTYEGLIELRNDFSFVGKDVHISCVGSEDFKLPENYVDLCFTSPPYFNTEIYSLEDTQSCVKYKTKEEWVSGFLQPTLENCYRSTKPGGYTVINIANVSSFKDLEDVTKEIAIQCGFILEDTLKLMLSSISGKGSKFEPIFVFKKSVD